MAVTPGWPAEDPELFAQVSHYGTKPYKSVIHHLVAAKYTDAFAAETNVDGYLKTGDTYDRP